MEKELKFQKYGKIVCAALLKDNRIYYTYGCHSSIFTLEDIGVLRHASQGFVTENGYFVDRILGLEIALYYSQIDYKTSPKDELFSEDLKKENNDVRVYQKKYKYIYKCL